jgi:P27 family predicted phage terminase small subunit
MRGRKPIPFPIKQARGTVRADRRPINPVEIAPVKATRPPSWLKDKLARKAWKEFSGWLEDAGILTKLDRVAMELLAVTYGKWREASAMADLTTTQTENGYVIVNAMISVSRGYAKDLRSLLSAFGMDPTSRSRLSIPLPKEPAKDPMEELLDAEG